MANGTAKRQLCKQIHWQGLRRLPYRTVVALAVPQVRFALFLGALACRGGGFPKAARAYTIIFFPIIIWPALICFSYRMGPLPDKLRSDFQAFDSNGNGSIEPLEIMHLFNAFYAAGTGGASFNLHQCTLLARAFSAGILLGSKPMVTENEFEAMYHFLESETQRFMRMGASGGAAVLTKGSMHAVPKEYVVRYVRLHIGGSVFDQSAATILTDLFCETHLFDKDPKNPASPVNRTVDWPTYFTVVTQLRVMGKVLVSEEFKSSGMTPAAFFALVAYVR